nr:MAG TPA: hypothetical protein [Caudoviricetes sp.]
MQNYNEALRSLFFCRYLPMILISVLFLMKICILSPCTYAI